MVHVTANTDFVGKFGVWRGLLVL